MKQVVVDTNVLISAALTPQGNANYIMQLISHNQLQLIYSEDILREYKQLYQPENDKLEESYQPEDEKPEESPVDTPTVGERMNPVPLGEAFTANHKPHAHRDRELNFTMQITEVVRGEPALEMAREGNRRNEAPDGYELLLVKVKFTVNSYIGRDGNDDAFPRYSTFFDFFTTTYAQNTTFVSVSGLRPRLHAQLYSGASTEGWLFAAITEDDTAPLLRFWDTFWFSLTD